MANDSCNVEGCSSTKPKNTQYLTMDDFEQWQDYYTKMVSNNYLNDDTSCSACDSNLQTCKACNEGLHCKGITFIVTQQCNLNCTYCYEDHEQHNCGQTMDKETAKKAVDFIFDEEKINGYYDFNKDAKGVILEFIGGEPLLEIDLIDYIVTYFLKKAAELDHNWLTDYVITMTSNGVLYNTEKVQNFIRKHKNKVNISISVDGNKELHDSCRVFPDGSGSYDIVEKSVETWIQQDSRPQTKMTIAPENIDYLVPAIKNLWDLGIPGVMANCVYEEGWTKEHATKLYNKLKQIADYLIDNNLYNKYYTSLFDEMLGGKVMDATTNYCGANGEMLAIDTDGSLAPCLRFFQHSLKNQKQKNIGNIYDGINQDNEFLQKLCSITTNSQSPNKCKKCEISQGCGLCLGYNYDHFGDPNKRATYICIMHQARVLANTYYWNKLYNKLNINKKFKLNIPKDWALKIISKEEYNNLLSMY
jgi:uncharacterized protein